MAARPSRTQGLVRNEVGQALTEFAIVIPVVLLLFFAMVQYFEIVKASQLANYAAYAAARVYAVRASVEGHDEAVKLATKAAALAMAPVASLAPGELGVDSSVVQTLMGAFPRDDFERLAQNGPDAPKRIFRMAKGYATALGLRLNPAIGFGGVKITTSGTPKQVDVELNYPQPIYVPGLAETWALVAGETGLHRSMSGLREGLGGAPAALLQAVEFSESTWAAQFNKLNVTLPKVILPYMNIRARCSMGFSDWGSKNPEYRPRLHAKGDEPDVNNDPEAKDLEKNAQESIDAAKKYNEAVEEAEKACKNLCEAEQKADAAEQEFNRLMADKDATAQQRAAAKTAWDQAEIEAARAEADYRTKYATLQNVRRVLAANGRDYPDVTCPCD